MRAFDIVGYFLNGIRRYVITLPITTPDLPLPGPLRATVHWLAREFFGIVGEVFPYPLQSVLTDNGSECMKHFDKEIRRLHKNHWHRYRRTPKMNAHVERFNRTIQKEFIDYHEDLLVTPTNSIAGLIP